PEGRAGHGSRRRACAHARGAPGGRGSRAAPPLGPLADARKDTGLGGPAATGSSRLQLPLPSFAVLLYGVFVIDRYTRPETGRIWSEESKSQAWLRVELAVWEAYARRGRIPAEAMARIRAKARVDIARILAIQERVKHELIALLTSLEEQVGPDSRFIHI